MPDRRRHTALFPGTFDPVTFGHLDIIERTSRLYSRLIVAIGQNPQKRPLFTPEERIEMIRGHVHALENVEILTYEGLTVRFAREVDAGVIVRGIRDNVDLHAELEIANTNLMISDIETVFLMASTQHALTSSTLIKQVVQIGGYDRDRLGRLIPIEVAEMLEARLRGQASTQ